MGCTTNQPIRISWGPLLCQLLVLYFLDQADTWGVLAEGLRCLGTIRGSRNSYLRTGQHVLQYFNSCQCAAAYLLTINPASTNEKLLFQRSALMPWIKEAVSFLNCLRGANVLQVFLQDSWSTHQEQCQLQLMHRKHSAINKAESAIKTTLSGWQYPQ